jgi:hypothetical protein
MHCCFKPKLLRDVDHPIFAAERSASLRTQSCATSGSDQHKVLIRRLPSGGSKVQEPALSSSKGSKAQSQIGKLRYFRNSREIDPGRKPLRLGSLAFAEKVKNSFSGRSQQKA